jgi:small multidrug resistance pump/quaternary ammonium compound-resistance protein SugE
VTFSVLVLASIAYACGGLFMKLSDGATHAGYTAAFLALFTGGALLQAVGMKQSDMGVAYIVVLGLEAVLAVLVSAYFLRESYTASRLAAIGLVLIGVAWLRAT